MDADWSVECGMEDPTVVVPWSNASGSLTYVDLRANPSAVSTLAEAQNHPALAAALRRWNQPDSPVFTAKCDVWAYPADLFDAEDLPGFGFAQGSYIDLLAVDPAVFASFQSCEARLRQWTRIARAIPLAGARCNWTLRVAQIFDARSNPTAIAHGTRSRSGFATTLYVWGYGDSPATAASAWSGALLALIEPVLNRG
jgi:hypothetical protein